MAYAALVSLSQTIDQILNHNRYSISQHTKQQIGSVHEQIVFLQGFLDDFPEKANNLEGRIRDIAHEAEDIIECFMLKQIHPCHWWTVGLSGVKFSCQLREVTGKIKSISGEVMDIMSSLRNKYALPSDFSAASSSSTLASTNKDVMIGFDNNLLEIKTRLCADSSQLQVIPIFGMGGIGKTTLAKNVYNDRLVMEHFQIRAWVTVSQNYSTQEILSSLLDSMKEFMAERSDQRNEEKVYKSLKCRRYLIVMDDMWSTEAWDDVRNIFPDDNNGSRIMLTTRLLDVAAYPDPCSPLYEMHLMDKNQSWNLLRQSVFPHQDCPPELEDIGKAIARSCKGLPLATVVVAGLLSTVSKTQTSWEKIAENVNSVVTEEHGQFEEILSLSYTHLPHHLRPCFLYLGGFPEDYEVLVSKLMKLWIAEGFLKRPVVSKSLEEEAEEYLEDLVKRSLVLVAKRKSNGKIKSCNIHDLMRNLCIRKACEEKFLLYPMDRNAKKGLSTERIRNQRRISSISSDPTYLSNIYGSTIRTIMCFGNYSSLASLESFRLLRVLDAEDAYVESLPVQLFELFHLRYLALNYNDIIPTAISKLQNLQTLIIYERGQLKHLRLCRGCLPQEIWRMPQLRHLVFNGMLPDPEGTTSALENLQTLTLVSHYTCAKGILKMLPRIKKMGINCAGYSGGTYLNNLVYLHQLENLELHSFFSNRVWRKQNFTFPRRLKKLTLSHFQLPWNEMTIVGSLPNLQVLKLRHLVCQVGTWETTEGEFPQLEFLLIERSGLKHWITESSHFPRLKYLMLHYCWFLEEIPYGIGEIPTLELIDVKGRGNKYLVLSARQILTEQQSWGNDALQVCCS